MTSGYCRRNADQEKRRFIEKSPVHTESQRNVHHISHHQVKKESLTTPITIVYDSSCRKSRDYPSLNDCFESTPPILNDWLDFAFINTLLRQTLNRRFCTWGSASMTEISQNFCGYQIIMTSELITYRFKVVLFEATCSPFTLNVTYLK